jgi:uncharacterized SAM-binding protein YcdF (DUF218 family)
VTCTGVALRDPRIAHAVETLWNYNNLQHEPHRTDVGIGLGSHDLSVATTIADLFHCGMFPLIVFTGANSPTTEDRFPQGEAAHYREHAISLGVPGEAILTEDAATNTGENITRTQELLNRNGYAVASVTLVSRPYQQRRAYATCRKLWPEVEPLCAATPLPLKEYFDTIGDEARVINMMVGDTQRIEIYANRGFAIPQPMPDDVRDAMALLVEEGYTARLI